ncbi:MAG: VOC family protein [Anaerolineae bacterium]|nr:VOC family protein [Anaerolineae bacterium]
MKIIGMHHAQITIPSGARAHERAWAFYCGLLGLPEVEKPAALKGRGGFWVQAGAIQVHIGVEDGVQHERSKAHLAYEVVNLTEVRARLLEAGYTVEQSIPIPGYARFESRDPFGNRIEFIQRLPGGAR